MRATRAVIHLDNLNHNLNAIRRRVGTRPLLCLTVKADAYGHGAVPTAEAAVRAGAAWLAVATCDEAVELREAGLTAPILLLSLPLPAETEELVAQRVSSVVADEELVSHFAAAAERTGIPARLHLAVDTGMGRIGCTPEGSPSLPAGIHSHPRLVLEGVCTHFSDADAAEREFTEHQIKAFDAVVEGLHRCGHDPKIVHAANSAALAGFPNALYDMVRAGLAAYGYEPSPRPDSRLNLRPVMEFLSKVVYLKRVPADTPISYGRTYHTTRETRIATVAAGYGDGYSRLLSNAAKVEIRRARYPVAGRVCMDQLMVDIGPSSAVSTYDDVTLFGPSASGPDAEELAGLIGTIPYEVLCAVSKRVPRFYV